MIIKKIRIVTEDGVELFGLLHLPKEDTKQVVIAVHGYSSNCFTKRDDIFAEELNKNNIAYFSFNNRGTEYCVKLRKSINNKEEVVLGGSAYEDILESHYDIKSAVDFIHSLGFEEIHLLGHSMGCTKIVYFYNKLKPTNIKSISLLSMTDIVGIQHSFLKDKYQYYLDIAMQKLQNGEDNNFMPKESFIHPIGVKTYLRYFKDNAQLNFIQYDNNYEFKALKDIDVPMCMRFGTVNETLAQPSQEIVELLKTKLADKRLDIGIIEGSNHSYAGKEEKVINKIINFIRNTKV